MINDLQRSTINEVVVSVMDSDANSKDTPTGTLPGLPFPELPVIAVISALSCLYSGFPFVFTKNILIVVVPRPNIRSYAITPNHYPTRN